METLFRSDADERLAQRTAGWFELRAGKVTASSVYKVMAKTKTGYSADRENYQAQLVVERMTGQPAKSYSNAAMEWGVEQEANARAAYEAQMGKLVEEVGFIPHPTIPMCGASPDGVVGDGLIEIKCPETATMIELQLSNKIPDKYLKQMQLQMRCADKQWCHFVVYDPRMPERLQLLILHVDRDDKLIGEMEAEIVKFLAEVDEKVKKLEAI
jgi:putative phage-type endonuclease